MIKICTGCSQELGTVYFYKNKNTKDGLAYSCKCCAKEYKDNNKARSNELRRENYKKDPIKYRIQSNKSHQDHSNDRLKKQRIYYENNKEAFSKRNKKYRNENLDEILLRNRQREKSLEQFPIIKQSEIDQLLKNNKHQCFYCKTNVKRGINLHLDHKAPLFHGGSHSIDNLVPACKSCNLKKGTKTVDEFLDRIK